MRKMSKRLVILSAVSLLLAGCATRTPNPPDVGAVVQTPGPEVPAVPALVQTTPPKPPGYFQRSLADYFGL
jgi:type IV pilus biogenesis protein CpaD/CtpE